MPLTLQAQPVAVITKDSTQEAHRDVENFLLPKLAAIRHRNDYAVLLRMFYGYYSPLEKKIERFITPSLLPDLAERRKAEALRHDLHALQSEAQMVVCKDLPKIDNEAQALGALYVLEGSTLGGKMIAKMLLQNTALSLTENEVRFFLGYKEDTGKKWKAFLEVLNRQPAGDVVEAANETFLQLKSWMQHFYHG